MPKCQFPHWTFWGNLVSRYGCRFLDSFLECVVLFFKPVHGGGKKEALLLQNGLLKTADCARRISKKASQLSFWRKDCCRIEEYWLRQKRKLQWTAQKTALRDDPPPRLPSYYPSWLPSPRGLRSTSHSTTSIVHFKCCEDLKWSENGFSGVVPAAVDDGRLPERLDLVTKLRCGGLHSRCDFVANVLTNHWCWPNSKIQIDNCEDIEISNWPFPSEDV